MAAVANDSVLAAAATLVDPRNSSRACGGGGLLSFSDETFVRYWARTVGGELTGEQHVDAVFMDGFDKLYSGSALATSCPGFAQANRTAAALLDKVAATARQAAVLNAAGKLPILSTYNSFSPASWEGYRVGGTEMNGVSEDA